MGQAPRSRAMYRTFQFVWVDVFAKNPLEGNQLAVFPDARGLTDEEMHAIARETHLSETTFVFPADEKTDLDRGFKTRIFAVFGEMVQIDPVIGQSHDPSAVAKALRVSVDDLDLARPIQTISTGVPFAIVPFKSLHTLSGARPDWTGMEEYLKGTDASFFYLVSRETSDSSASLHARMVFSGGEDPATGSAAGPAVAWMVLHGLAQPREQVLIEQGLEVRRASQIYASAALREGRPADVRVGGHCVPVIRGELRL